MNCSKCGTELREYKYDDITVMDAYQDHNLWFCKYCHDIMSRGKSEIDILNDKVSWLTEKVKELEDEIRNKKTIET